MQPYWVSVISLKGAGSTWRTFVKNFLSPVQASVSSPWRWAWCLEWEGERGGWQDLSCIKGQNLCYVWNYYKKAFYILWWTSESKWPEDIIVLCKKNMLVSCCGTGVTKILLEQALVVPQRQMWRCALLRVMVRGYSSDSKIAFMLWSEKSMNEKTSTIH